MGENVLSVFVHNNFKLEIIRNNITRVPYKTSKRGIDDQCLGDPRGISPGGEAHSTF